MGIDVLKGSSSKMEPSPFHYIISKSHVSTICKTDYSSVGGYCVIDDLNVVTPKGINPPKIFIPHDCVLNQMIFEDRVIIGILEIHSPIPVIIDGIIINHSIVSVVDGNSCII